MSLKTLRAMKPADIPDVVALIDSHDEDDAEAAEAGFSHSDGIEDHFVLVHEGALIGVCGFRTPPACDRTHWLSWTYVHADHVNRGHGRRMLEELLDHLRSLQARKIFVKVSDYTETDDDGTVHAPYAAALHLYQRIGFAIELTHRHYYDAGESMIVLGKRLDGKTRSRSAADDAEKDPQEQTDVAGDDADFDDIATASQAAEANIDLDSLGSGPLMQTRPVQFNAVYEIAETDDAFSFGWHDDGRSLFTTRDVEIGLDEVRKREGRAVFLSFPSDYQDIDERLYAAGFHNSGVLDDYFEDGVHERHYTYHFRQDLQLTHD